MATIFNNSIQGVRLLIDVIKIAKKEIRELVEISKKVTKEMKFETSKDFKNLDKEIDEVTKSTKELLAIEKQETQLKKELVNLEKAQSQALKAKQSATIQARKEQERQANITRKISKETEKLNSIYARESAQLNKLRKRYKDLILSENGATSATRKLKNEIQALDRRLKQADADVGQFQRSVGDYKQALAGSLGTVGQFATGAGAIAAGVLLAGKAISSAIDIIKGFEQANANLQAVLGITREEMGALIKQAKQLGASTAFTASEVTLLQTEFAKLGFPTRDIQLMTQSTLDAAVAMGADLGEAAKLTGATLKAFKLDASEAQRVNDVLSKSTSASALDFQKLNSSMSTIAPVAAKFGFSLEGTVSLLGELSNAGFDASSAATATRNILLNLADTNSKLGKSLKEPVKDLPSLVRGLKQLKAEGTDLGKALELTDKRSVAAFATFLDGTDSVLKLNEALENAQGTAAEMAAIQLDTLEGSIKILNSSWEGLILSMEDGSGIMTKISRVIIDDLAKGLSIISGESKEAKKEFSLLGLILTSAKQSFSVFVGVLKILTIPMRIMIDIVKRLAQRFGLIGKSFGSVKDALQSMIQLMNNLPEITDIIVNAIVKSFSKISDVIIGIALIFKGFFSDLKDRFASASKIVVGYGTLIGSVIINGLKGNIEGIKKSFKTFGDLIGEEFINLSKNKDIARGSELIAAAFTSGLGDFEEAKEKIEALFRDSEELAKELGKGLDDDTIDDTIDKTEELNGLIEEQTKLVSELQKQKKEATGEAEIKRLTVEIEAAQKELDRLIALGKKAKEDDSAIKAAFDLAVFRKEQAIKEEEELETRIQNEIALVNFKAEELLKNEQLLQDERTLIIEQAIADRNEIAKRGDEERAATAEAIAAAELEERKKRAQRINEIVGEIARFQKEKFNERQKQLDDEIKGSEDQQKRLQDLADRGSETAKENLASERKREADLRLQKQQEQEKQKQTELLFKGLDVFSANRAAGQSPGEAAANTITTITLLGQALKAINFFKEGTEDTGTVANPLDSSGGRLAVLHDKERIVPQTDNIKMRGISNYELGNLAEAYKRGELVKAEQNKINVLSQGSWLSNDRILQELEKTNKVLSELPKNMPKSELNVDLIKQVLTLTESQGGKVVNHHIRINKRRSWG